MIQSHDFRRGDDLRGMPLRVFGGVEQETQHRGWNPVAVHFADLIKRAMLAVDARLRDEGLASRQVLQVHDELVVEAAPGDLVLRDEPVLEEVLLREQDGITLAGPRQFFFASIRRVD